MKPNAKKLQDHQRKKERKAAEKELKERQERVKRAREAQERAAKEAQEDAGMDEGPGMGGMPGMGGLGGLFNDPEMMAGVHIYNIFIFKTYLCIFQLSLIQKLLLHLKIFPQTQPTL